MRLKNGLLQSANSKVVFRTFLETLKQITQSYSSYVTDYQHGFEMDKYLKNTFK